MPNSRFALHGCSPSLIHGLYTIFASNSRFMRLFQAPPLTPLSTAPFFASLSVHGLHFTASAPSITVGSVVVRFRIFWCAPIFCREAQNTHFMGVSGTKKRGVLQGCFCQSVHLSWLCRSECQMCCWAQSFGVFFVSLGVALDSADTPFAKTPFSWFLSVLGPLDRKSGHPKNAKSNHDPFSGLSPKVREPHFLWFGLLDDF